MKKYKLYIFSTLLITLLAAIPYSRAAIGQIAGLAVAQTSTLWNNVKDAAAGDHQTSGILATNGMLWTGTDFVLQRGTIAGGILTQATLSNAGANNYNIELTNLTTSSQNLPFGFTSTKIIVETPATNTQNICVNWLGGTAVCPASNTAGNDVIAPGRLFVYDFLAETSISAIAASGTQTVFVRAF